MDNIVSFFKKSSDNTTDERETDTNFRVRIISDKFAFTIDKHGILPQVINTKETMDGILWANTWLNIPFPIKT